MILMILCSSFANAQAPAIEWQKRIGSNGDDYSYESAYCIDGGVLIGGYTMANISGEKSENSKGRFDYWVVRTDTNGMITWDKTIGGASPNDWEDEILTDVVEVSDGFLLLGTSDSPISGDKTIDAFNESEDIWIVKINFDGIIQWQQVFGGNLGEVPISTIQTSDGGYMIGGYSNSGISGNKNENSRGLTDYWILKLDAVGNLQWQRTIGGSGDDNLSTLIQTPDEGYLIGGRSNSGISGEKSDISLGLYDIWILKLNNVGIIEWQKTIGGSADDYLTNIIPVDNKFILAANSSSPISGNKSQPSRGLNDGWIVEIDANGVVLNDITIGGSGNDILNGMISTADANYVVSFTSNSPISGEKTEASQNYDGWIMKITPVGTILWQDTIGGTGSDGFRVLGQMPDGGFMLSGGTDSPVSGDVTQTPRGGQDYWLFKLAPDNLDLVDNFINSYVVVAPNPVESTLNLSIANEMASDVAIYNVLGECVLRSQIYSSNFCSDVSHLKAGCYFVNITTEKIVLKTTFVKL